MQKIFPTNNNTAAFMIAILPSYHSAGITATLLFIVLRIIQGATIGGEIPIVVAFCQRVTI